MTPFSAKPNLLYLEKSVTPWLTSQLYNSKTK